MSSEQLQSKGMLQQSDSSGKYQPWPTKKCPVGSKRGIAQKLATKIGGSESMSEDFGSQHGKSNNYAVGSEVNFGSDPDE